MKHPQSNTGGKIGLRHNLVEIMSRGKCAVKKIEGLLKKGALLSLPKTVGHIHIGAPFWLLLVSSTFPAASVILTFGTRLMQLFC